ncbi:MAG: DinB family protein [Terracidiphilus sp.]
MMATELSLHFRAELELIQAALLALSPQLADTPWRNGGWTRKQIVGHLLDSTANNRQRFARASIDGSYVGPEYAQDAWVAVHGYSGRSWETLLDWWRVEHEILASVADRIPEERFEASCTVGENAPVALRFLVEDYIRHQHWHLAQLTAPVVAT